MPGTALPGRLFPANVTLPDGRLLRTVLVWANQDGSRSIYGTSTAHVGEPVPGNPRVVKVATLEAGDVTMERGRWLLAGAVLERGSGCGCSHPLKRWSPPAPAIKGS